MDVISFSFHDTAATSLKAEGRADIARHVVARHVVARHTASYK